MCIADKRWPSHWGMGGGGGGEERGDCQQKVAKSLGRGIANIMEPHEGSGRGGVGGSRVLQVKCRLMTLMREVGITDTHIIHTLQLVPRPSSPVHVTIISKMENHGKSNILSITVFH